MVKVEKFAKSDLAGNESASLFIVPDKNPIMLTDVYAASD